MTTIPGNWDKIDLNSHEIECNILDPIDFQQLLLEVNCNIQHITKQSIKQQFENDLDSKIETARNVFNANLDRILVKAIRERLQDLQDIELISDADILAIYKATHKE